MFIETETTPDPDTLKFLPNREVLPQGTLTLDPGESARSPLAERLFRLPGVTRLELGPHYIRITAPGQNWQHLKPEALGAIMDHFMSGAPVLRREPGSAGAGGDDTAERIREAIRQVIDPELGFNIVDLGLIYRVDFGADGATVVTMTTTTPGCPATNYLQTGTGEATRSVPGVTSVDVQLTYEPRWDPGMMSPAAKAHFGME